MHPASKLCDLPASRVHGQQWPKALPPASLHAGFCPLPKASLNSNCHRRVCNAVYTAYKSSGQEEHCFDAVCGGPVGQAPPRWGNFGSMDLTQPDLGTQLVLAPTILPVTATTEEKFQANLVRRAHPLYSLVTLKLLQEIMNGRLFTTVSPGPSCVWRHTSTASGFFYLTMARFNQQRGDEGGSACC